MDLTNKGSRSIVCPQLWSFIELSQQEVNFGPNLTKYNCVCISFHLFRNGPLTIRNIRFFQVIFLCHKLIFLKYWTRVLLNYFHFCNTLLSKHEPSFFWLQLKINRNLIETAVGELDQFVFQKHRSCWIRNIYFWKTLQLWAY